MAVKAVTRYEPRLTKQSAPQGSEAFATKIDENLLLIKRAVGDMTVNVNQVLETLNITPGGASPTVGGITFDFGSDTYTKSSGSEQWCDERLCDFPALTSPSFSIAVLGIVASGAGTLLLRVRSGGTSGQPDGAIVAVVTSAGGAIAYKSTGVNPGAAALLKFTLQSSAPSVTASARAVAITVR